MGDAEYDCAVNYVGGECREFNIGAEYNARMAAILSPSMPFSKTFKLLPWPIVV